MFLIHQVLGRVPHCRNTQQEWGVSLGRSWDPGVQVLLSTVYGHNYKCRPAPWKLPVQQKGSSCCLHVQAAWVQIPALTIPSCVISVICMPFLCLSASIYKAGILTKGSTRVKCTGIKYN